MARVSRAAEGATEGLGAAEDARVRCMTARDRLRVWDVIFFIF